MLDEGPVTMPGESAAHCAHTDTRHLTDNKQLRRQIEQQRLALTHLSQALIGLRRGTQALRDENRELRRELGAVRDARRVPAAGPGGQAHADRIDEILRGASS